MAQTPNDTGQLLRWLTQMAVQDGAICIAPYPGPMAPKSRDFLEGLRRIPSAISAPPGENPYNRMLRDKGHFLIVWVPE